MRLDQSIHMGPPLSCGVTQHRRQGIAVNDRLDDRGRQCGAECRRDDKYRCKPEPALRTCRA